jgi:signal transduction histidine kinase
MIDAIADREDMIKEYQTDLNKKIDTLQEVEQLKEDFVATLTHDLKVPIMAEKNMLSFLLNNRFGELNDYQKEALTHLQNSNRELVELVEIILETYKLNETQIDLVKEKLCVNDLLKEAIEEMKPIYESDSIQVNFFTEFDGDVSMDKFYVKRVLKNLILNAISFSEPYSKIDTAVCIDEKNVFIKITNYGKGIKKEELKHIFDKYYTTAKKFRKVGTGLGLYLSNKIVKEHKGRIMVESQNDDWTTFAIVLPR